MENRKYTVLQKKDRLPIFLMKMKLGVTFSTLSFVWCLQNNSISRIFYSYLEELSSATAYLVFWPNTDVLQATIQITVTLR